jgi:ADP-ribosyl-[dinitrogen reductase] hydrolase
MSASTAALPPLPLRHCYWVVPGLLLAGEHPNGPTRDKTKDRLKKLLAAGIECFVDLTKPTELLRYDTYLPFYVEYARKSIRDHGLPGSRAQMTEILDYIANSMRAGRPVYVHCRAGIGRTGTVVGCLLAERGLAGDGALDELNRLWQQCRRSKSWAFIPETDAQASYVREWQPTLEGGGFELSSLATAVATVGPMTTAGSLRPGVLSVADVQARAASQTTGAGQARAAVENLAAGKGRSGSSNSGAAFGGGSGLSAAAAQARAAVERGEVLNQGSVPSRGGGSSQNVASTQKVGSTQGALSRRGVESVEGPGFPNDVRSANDGARNAGAGLQPRVVDDRREVPNQDPGVGTTTHDAGHARGGGRNAATSTHAHDVVERGEISPSIRAEIADAMAGRSPTAPLDLDASVTLELPGLGAGATARSPGGGGGGRSPGAAAGVATGSSGAGAAAVAGSAGVDTRGAAGSAGVSAGATGRSESVDMRAVDDLTSGVVPSRDRSVNQPVTPDSVASQPTVSTRSPAGPAAEPAADFDPLLDSATLAAARGLRERFVGTLFGLAVGDAVAAATQFRRPGSFSPIGDMIGGGPFDLPRGAWSDDTAMALCLAESLLERDGFDARDQVQRYSRWQQEGYLTSTGQCVGITASTARSLALAKWRRVVFPGSHDPELLDPEPLSRIAPVALYYFASPETTLVQSADASRTTCQAPAVLDACRRLGRALNAALSGQPKTKILVEVAAITEGAAQTNNTAATALAAAFWAFSSTDNFRDAVLRAANVGGNSDVVASVCGQLAGAYYGVSAIPQSWRSGLMEKDLIEGYADRLLAHSLVSLSNS